MNSINVIGLGYIGLPTAAMFADNGVKVLGVDVSPKIVDVINSGNIHIEEPGLATVVKKVVENSMFKASLEPMEADAFIIAVPTPNKNDEYKSCDITYVIDAVKKILPVIKKGNLVIIESTIAPRTTEDYVKPILEKAGFIVGEDIFLAHCPERVLPGQILFELVNNNRIVGGITDKCSDKASELYKAFVKGEIIKTLAKTAEMSKLMENTFRDVNIALANELTMVCNSLDISVIDVIEMANKHPRVDIHHPGIGVGGHCLAVDPYYICAKAPELSNIIKLSRDTNCFMPDYVVENVVKLLSGDNGQTISVLGVTYKPNVDDCRESPALKIIDKLKKLNFNIKVHDPHVKNETYIDIDEAISETDMILVLVGHEEFKVLENIDREDIKFVFDPSNFLDIKKMKINTVNYGNLWSKIN